MKPTKPIDRLLEVMAQLRAPQGCPWDREQTHASIKPQLIEECYEAVDAIDRNDMGDLREELGDVLLHVAFHSQMASERGDFDFDAVASGIVEKLVRRHPHVFAKATAQDSGAVVKQWHEIKKEEKPERDGALEGVPASLPALMRAQEIQKKASRAGFDWPDVVGVMAKVDEELAEVKADLGNPAKLREEIGDLLFVLVRLADYFKFDAEDALRAATAKFQKRFECMESSLKTRGQTMEASSFEEKDAAWREAKSKVG